MSNEKTVIEFFRRRFPDKSIAFEKECGYFGEWIVRFESGNPEVWMDRWSKAIWQKMQEDGFK